MSDDLREYLQAVYGTGTGFAHLGIGTGQHVADDKFKFRGPFGKPWFHWPDEAAKLERAISQAAAAGDEVYICPYLMTGHERGRGQSTDRRLIHSDCDGVVSLDKVQALGGFAVGSGTGGHAHVYVPLTESVSLDHHRALCDGLRAYLGGDDKISDNDLLRPPGTWNHKPVAFGTGQAAPVSWLRRPSGAARRPQELAEALGVVLATNGPQTAASGLQAAAPVDLTRLPTRVSDALAEVTGDRSDDTMRVVFACQDTGLTLAKTRAVVSARADLRQRLAERHDDDVRECWLKVTDARAADRLVADWLAEIERAEDARLGQAGTTQPVAAGNEPAERIFTMNVEQEAQKLRVRAAARALVEAEQRAKEPALPAFDAGTLAELLARPAEPPHRVEGLIPTEASTLIVAIRKAGKTTLQLNLARSLILGADFLGRFPVRPISGRVGLLNYEVSGAQYSRWAHEVGIPADKLFIVNLRGCRNPLGHDEDRQRLADLLRGQEVEALMVDPFGRAYTGKNQNDGSEVGAWLADLDRFARGDVGATDLILSAHTGWEGERSRGSSDLEGWPDSIITMTRRKAGENEAEDPYRYLRADGRDIDVDEDRLDFDPATRLLTMSGEGSRKKANSVRKAEDLIPKVVAYVNDHPTCSQDDLEKGVGGRATETRAAAIAADQRGLISRTRIGSKWSHLPNSSHSSALVPDGRTTSSPRLYRDEDEVEPTVTNQLSPDGTSSDVACGNCSRPVGYSTARATGGLCSTCHARASTTPDPRSR